VKWSYAKKGKGKAIATGHSRKDKIKREHVAQTASRKREGENLEKK